MLTLRRLLPLAAIMVAGAVAAAPAAASSTQETIFQDDGALKANPVGTIATLHDLGVTRIRVSMIWNTIAPGAGSHSRPRFNASDSRTYGGGWNIYDTIDREAHRQGIQVYFMLTGPAPLWATGRGVPGGGSPGPWEPNANEFGAFVHAAGQRYGGAYKPPGHSALPRINFWSIWNEPNYGYDLAPQATQGGTVETGANLYRDIVRQAWIGLTGTGHRPGPDTILIGETAPRGVDPPGDYNGVKPLRFLRALYCVDSRFRVLTGSSAALRGCPTSAAGRHNFRRDNPALFQASGFADHPYALQAHPGPPTQPTTQTGAPGRDSDFSDFPQLGALEFTLDRLNRVYGSHTRFPIWNTEFGYRTRPPDPHAGSSQATAALYMNEAEYLSWRQSRITSYMQYLYFDPPSGVFASGLVLPGGRPKATLGAFRMPLYLPSSSTRRGRTLEVWGGVRPAPVAAAQTHRVQVVAIQFQSGRGPWSTVQSVTLHGVRGYFDIRVKFPRSGNVRLAWTYPSGPRYYSRTVSVTVR